MDAKELRNLNNRLINAQARLERAILAKRRAEIEVAHLRTLRDEALVKLADEQVEPRYNVRITSGGTNKIQAIKAVRQIRCDAGLDYGLREAKDYVDFAGSPDKSTFLKGVTFDVAQKALKMLKECGADALAQQV